MTNYGTIPTTSSPERLTSSNLDHINQRIKQSLRTPRSWQIMFNLRSFRPPTSVSDAISRIQTNISYFRLNYAVIVFIIIFLSLAGHPFSLIIFAAAWCLFYCFFRRQQPVVIFQHMVLIAMSVFTVVLLLTHAKPKTLAAILIVVVGHAALRKTDDLFLNEEEATLG